MTLCIAVFEEAETEDESGQVDEAKTALAEVRHLNPEITIKRIKEHTPNSGRVRRPAQGGTARGVKRRGVGAVRLVGQSATPRGSTSSRRGAEFDGERPPSGAVLGRRRLLGRRRTIPIYRIATRPHSSIFATSGITAFTCSAA
jgi:hypothetical protein